MKRSKLSVSASLPLGSMPPTSTWYAVPRCFACDDAIKSHRFSTSLLLGHTHYTHSSIPGKLGEYIGEGFVVVVTSEDALCRTCMNLLNTMDRLEEELKDHRNKLVGNLRRKYGLDPGGTQPTAKLNRKQVTKVIEDDDDIIEIQSDEEWTPYNKKRKVTPSAFPRTKTLTCNVCKMEFVDLNRFMTHLKMHREAAQQPKAEVPSSNVGETFKSFKCGCCTLSFDKKEALATHMKQHTGDQLLNRPTASAADRISLVRSNLPTNSSNGNKLFPKPTSQTVVEMKLIMDPGQKKSSSQSPPLEKPVTVTKVTDKDPGGKVCLLALWNSGSCSDHTDCQNPSCVSQFHPKATINVQQTSQAVVTQKDILAPKIVVRPSQDSVKMPVVSQPQFEIGTSVGQQSKLALVPSISQANTHVITIPHSVTTQTQLPVNISGSTQHIVVSIPNQSNVNYNISTQDSSELTSLENQEIILNTSDNNLPEPLTQVGQSSDIDQKIVVLPSVNLNEQSINSVEGQLPEQTLNSAVSASKSQASKSMPSLDDAIVSAESTRVANMKNIAIVNVEAEGDETDWYLASEQSNAALETPHTLWGQDSSKSAIEQVDGAPRFCSALPFDAREQSDSVDESEKSDYFSSRYVVDSEMRQVAEELGKAIDAAFKT